MNIPDHIVHDILEIFRLTDKLYDCTERDTCYKRKVMRTWHQLSDVVKDGDTDLTKSLEYYTNKELNPNKI